MVPSAKVGTIPMWFTWLWEADFDKNSLKNLHELIYVDM